MKKIMFLYCQYCQYLIEKIAKALPHGWTMTRQCPKCKRENHYFVKYRVVSDQRRAGQ